MIDDWRDVLEGWVADSKGKIRGDKAHDKLVALGYTGTDRTTRRALAEIKSQWRLGNTRVHRPWITEPGLWLQYDFGDGPIVAGRKIVLLVAWLAWCRYRVVIPLRDRTAPSVFAGLDRIFRILGGAPTYLLTDNEKTVTTGHIAGVPVRNRAAVTFGRYYGISVLTCEPADPASKGGVENAVKLAKADIVPTETNLLPAVRHLRRRRSGMLGVHGRDQCPRAPRHGSASRRDAQPGTHRAARGARPAAHRRVGGDPPGPRQHPDGHLRALPILLPATLLGQTVWIRHHDGTDEVVICALDDGGPVEVARHRRATPGSPAIDDSHFPEHRDKIPGDYRIRARSASRADVPGAGPGAAVWLKEAAARRHRTDHPEDGPRRRTVRAGRPRRRRLGAGSRRRARPLRHRRSRFHPGRQGPGPHPSWRRREHLPGARHQRVEPVRPQHHRRTDEAGIA